MFFVAQLFSLGVQLLVTPWVHRKLGVLAGLLFLPAALLLGSAAFLLVPVLAVITFAIGSEASFSYSINQASKEILYVPLDKVSKYKGKAFIDMFVLRAAKTLGAAVVLLYTFWLRGFGLSPRWLMVVGIAGIFIWLFSIRVIHNSSAYRQIRSS